MAGTLTELRRRGNMLALITDGNHIRQHAKVRALGLDDFFGRHNVIRTLSVMALLRFFAAFEPVRSADSGAEKLIR